MRLDRLLPIQLFTMHISKEMSRRYSKALTLSTLLSVTRIRFEDPQGPLKSDAGVGG